MQLARAEWGGPAAEHLLILSFATRPEEESALEAEVARRAATLPDPPGVPDLDDTAFRELQAAVVQAKQDHAAAQSRVLGYAGTIRTGTPRATAGGPVQLLDDRDAAVEAAKKAKARYDELVQMEQRARMELGQRRQDASTAALKVYRDQLAGMLRQLDEKLAQVMLHDVLPAALACRVRLEELSLG
jgi:hypothetical protein